MTKRVSRSNRAVADVIEAALHLEAQRTGLAERFITATERAFDSLAGTPGLGRVREFATARLLGLRSWRIRGFENWLVFYRVTDEAVEIVRVLHGSRDLEAAFEDEGESIEHDEGHETP